jgi:polyribonucleotide nucleotidyltransferase
MRRASSRSRFNPDKIREVIGSRQAKSSTQIIADTGVKIDIQDDGTVFIASPDFGSRGGSKRIIDGIVKEIEVGDVYSAAWVGIKEFGAFINLNRHGSDSSISPASPNKPWRRWKTCSPWASRCWFALSISTPKTGKISFDPQGHAAPGQR